MTTNAYSKKAAYSLCSIEEAKQISEALGGTVWYHEGAKTYSIGTNWSIDTNEGRWLGNRDSEAEAVEFAQRMKGVKVNRVTVIYLESDSGDPEDAELIEDESVTIWQN